MRAVILLLALFASACAVTPASQGALDSATAACSQGDRKACSQLPALNAQVRQENANNAAATGIAAAAGGAVVGGALAAPYGYPYGYRPYGYPNPYRYGYRPCYGCW